MKYSHMYTVAFTVVTSEPDPDKVTALELAVAMANRAHDVERHDGQEAVECIDTCEA